MNSIAAFVAIFMIACIALMAGVRFKRITVLQMAVVVFIMSYVGYGLIEYPMTNSLGVVVCMGSLLFAAVGIPSLVMSLALEKWVSRHNSE